MKCLNWYIFGFALFCNVALFSGIGSSQFTSDELARLAQERVTNLVIINDVDELIYHDLAMLEYSTIGAMMSELIKSLSFNQLVLCPKTMWISVQNAVHLFKNFTSKSFVALNEDQERYQKICLALNTNSDLIDQLKRLLSSMPLRKTETAMMQEELNALMRPLNTIIQDSSLSYKQRNFIEELFAYYIYHESIVAQEYICKEVKNDIGNSDFLLFVPKELQNIDSSVIMQDALLGIAWSNLPDYDYQKQFDDHTKRGLFLDVFSVNESKMLGKKLLNALKIITLKNEDIPMHSRAFFNYYIAGHGVAGALIAEMSTLENKNKDGVVLPSDFLNVLNFFNQSRTKSVTLLSCYPAGKKFIDTYKIENFYNHTVLQNIVYPLIIKGSTYVPTMVHSLSANLLIQLEDIIDLYFKVLNEVPPNYLDAAILFSGGLRQVNNYVNIKFPHTAWFSPVRYKTIVKELSQIAMSTVDKPISVSNDVRIVLLSANYFKQPITFDCVYWSDLPVFLPVNYMNQNYIFESVMMPNMEKSWHEIFEKCFLYKIEEPINFIFKKFQTKNETLENLHVFIHEKIDAEEEYTMGFIYTDSSGQTKIASWPSGSRVPSKIEEKIFSLDKANQLRLNVEQKAKEKLVSGLEPEFISKLSNLLEAKKTSEIIKDSSTDWVKDSLTKKWTAKNVSPEKLAEGVEALRQEQALKAQEGAREIKAQANVNAKQTDLLLGQLESDGSGI